MAIVRKTFTIMGQDGTAVYREGTAVPEEIAQKYPRYMEGFIPVKTAHDPSLRRKPSKREIAAMTEEKMLRWIKQYHPAAAPEKSMDRPALQELVTTLAQG
jgi:hypothetical protein